jgi:hypothetical protein
MIGEGPAKTVNVYYWLRQLVGLVANDVNPL